MNSELTKRIFTSIILLIGTFSFLIYMKEVYFLLFIITIGIICYCEWILTNSSLLASKNLKIFFSIHIFGFIYFLIILPVSAFYLRIDISLNFFLFILIICIFSDIGGYTFGKTIGGMKLTKISPNKTISGSIGSFVFSLLPLIFIYFFNIEEKFLKLNLLNIIFSLIVSLICQLGDLFFSYFKRLNNKKNTSNLLPGHGGLLDRIDGLVIVVPTVCLIKFFENF